MGCRSYGLQHATWCRLPPPPLACRNAQLAAHGAAGAEAPPPASTMMLQRDVAVAVHPGLVDTFLARNYFKQSVPRPLRPLSDPFFEHLFCPYLLRRCVVGPARDSLQPGHTIHSCTVSPTVFICLHCHPCCSQPQPALPVRPPSRPHPFRLRCLCSPEAAAQTVLYAATAPAAEVGGQYCGTSPHVSKHSAAAGDPVLAEHLWELSAHLCQLGPSELLD
jgi:hypothetical protein